LAPEESIPVSGGYSLGVSESAYTLYVKSGDVSCHKKAGQPLLVDDREFIIDKITYNMGITEIKLSQTGGV